MRSIMNIAGLFSVLSTNKHNLLLLFSVALTVPIYAASQLMTNTSLATVGFCGNKTLAVRRTLEHLHETHIEPLVEWSQKANNDVCNSWAVESGLAAETAVAGSKFCKNDAVLPILNASELLSSGLLKQICESDKEMTAAAKKMCAHYMKEVLLPALDASSTFMSYELLCKLITGQCISNEEK
uniref:Uncharacterized protein n=1 Tax=Ditylenchus dipsaci TaxID=166011 RepID=A0A915D247_9BILA